MSSTLVRVSTPISKDSSMVKRPGTVCGMVNGAYLTPWMMISNVEPSYVEVNVNDGVPLDGSAGFVTMLVFGAVRSTSTLRIAVAV